MEKIVQDGLARSWGISSWNGFRVDTRHPEYLSLDWLFTNKTHNLRYLQFPVGLWGSEAITGRWQRGENILDRSHGLGILTNSPLLQGELALIFGDRRDLIDYAVCFVRDTEKIDAVLVGITQQKHVEAWERMQYRHPECINNIIYQYF
jgi:aryl-alcohol dehydrogenase-like predicted oxidoreductase